MTVFKNSPNDLKDGKFYKDVLQTPTMVIDLAKKSDLQKLSLSQKSTVYIVLNSSKNDQLQFIKRDLDLVTKLSMPGTRPRCLLLLPAVKDFETLQKVLDHAWSLKFLDFSIITGNSSLFYYNPFTSVYTTEPLTPHSTIFLDKMENMHGYELKLPFIDSSPYIVRKINNTYGGSEYRIIRAVSKILNFKLVVLDYGSGYCALKNAVKDLELGTVNVLPFTLFDTHPLTLNNPSLVRGKVFLFDSFRGVVSSTLTSRVNFNPNYRLMKILIFLFTGIAVVLVLVHLSNLLKISKQKFETFTTVQLVLGEPGVKYPKASVDRIIYLSIVILSMTYFNDIFAGMTEYELMDSPVVLKNFDDVSNSMLTPYINTGIYNWIFNNSDKSLEAIKLKARNSSSTDCVQ